MVRKDNKGRRKQFIKNLLNAAKMDLTRDDPLLQVSNSDEDEKEQPDAEDIEINNREIDK